MGVGGNHPAAPGPRLAVSSLSLPALERVAGALASLDWSPSQCRQLTRLVDLFSSLSPPPDPLGRFGDFTRLQANLRQAVAGSDPERLEESFLELYAHLHGHQAPYTADERRAFARAGGYWCHAGGISPIVRAQPYLNDNAVSVDLGAGNGLQGLLLQWLYPHRLAIQVELSAAMIECGRALQNWLGIAEGRVRWSHTDLLDYQPQAYDFVYLYRPLRPQGAGSDFYRRLAGSLDSQPAAPVIFSIADCLRPFLPARFEVFYTDGQLTCYRRNDG